MQHHAFVIEAPVEEGVELALGYAERELGLATKGNPDVVVLRHGLLSAEDARLAGEHAAQGAFRGSTKVIIIAANRAYHEAQNMLLKLFEEPPKGTVLFLVLPTLGGLLPTLRSRVQELKQTAGSKQQTENPATEFLRGSVEKRAALVKRLTSGKDEESRRENRDEAIALVNGIEAALAKQGVEKHAADLSELARLRDFLYDRSAPVKQILEHLALVIPKS